MILHELILCNLEFHMKASETHEPPLWTSSPFSIFLNFIRKKNFQQHNKFHKTVRP